MLVLTRRPGEQLQISDDVLVTVSDVHEGSVDFRIEAPAGIAVHPREAPEARIEVPNPTDTTDDVHLYEVSRRRDESAMIGPEISVVVVDIRRDDRGDRARIGVEAPSEVPIYRREVYEAILRERRHSRDESR